jgi:hypothetical protein
MDDMPLGSRERNVKAGGCLTYVPDQSLTPPFVSTGNPGRAGLIYALKGNNTNQFFAYDVSGNFDWTEKESVPYDPNGRSKRVKRGAALCYDGSRYIYATKGNNTTEFWRYDTKTDTITDTIWKLLLPVPQLPSGKKLKGGTGLAFVTKGSDHYVYLLKGSKTTDFYAFHIEGDSWLKNLPPAPLGPSGKPFKKGSGMTKVDDYLYVLKSYKNELYRYDLQSDTWFSTPVSILPFYNRNGKKKKVKDGAALCYDGVDLIYAFKGGNTREFWSYSISQDTWIQNADIPAGPRNRKVKSGGALTFAQGRVYGLKGNNTREFWKYSPGPTAPSKNEVGKLTLLSISKQSFDTPLTVFPNPSQGLLQVYYSPANIDNACLKIFDVSGTLRRRLNVTSKNGTIDLPATNLASGVYFLRLETEKLSLTRKFILKK